MVMLTSFPVFAGTVRSVDTNGTNMVPIYLRLGRSTVLRFQEKPKKVVLGNSNYYGIEFINNDIAIQPRGNIPTNLFVYGQKNIYGFLLRPSDGNYDDLVRVYWMNQAPKPQMRPAVLVSPIREVSRPSVSFHLGHFLKATVDRISRFQGRDFYLMDMTIKNIAGAPLKLSGLQASLSFRSENLPLQEFVVRKNHVNAGQSVAVRLLFTRKIKTSLTLALRFNNLVDHRIISWRYF